MVKNYLLRCQRKPLSVQRCLRLSEPYSRALLIPHLMLGTANQLA